MFDTGTHLNAFFRKMVMELYPSLPLSMYAKICLTKGKTHDYQFNMISTIGKNIKTEQKEISRAICVELLKNEMIGSVDETIGGTNIFLNINLSPNYISKEINQYYPAINEFGIRYEGSNGKKIICDFSSPNIAKEMHVGHLRSTIIGDSIARILSFQGFDVHRVNHLGDWGTQFGMLIAYLKEGGVTDYTLSDLMKIYQESKKRFDSDTEFNIRAHVETKLLQQGDLTNRDLWMRICQISRVGFDKIYDQLEVFLEEKGESFYQSRMIELVDRLTESGLVVEENGMKIIFPKGHTVPFILQKSDGSFLYDTSDLTCLLYRIKEENADRIIYVVDNSQQDHFKQLFQLAEDLNICSRYQLVHVGFGMVLGPDGKKLKSRSGDTVKLQELFDEAYENAKKLTTNLAREKHPDWDQEKINSVSKVLAISSIKYADLSNPRENNYKFSFKKMLRADGNTGVYILYGYARCCSILNKLPDQSVIDGNFIILSDELEWKLAKKLIHFRDAINDAEETLSPHHICNYMYDLLGIFSNFYDKCRCIDYKKEKAEKAESPESPESPESTYETKTIVNENRVRLVRLTQIILNTCLQLVGMEYVEGI